MRKPAKATCAGDFLFFYGTAIFKYVTFGKLLPPFFPSKKAPNGAFNLKII
jgi:hypothetical protein